jgi:hypothetical protein
MLLSVMRLKRHGFSDTIEAQFSTDWISRELTFESTPWILKKNLSERNKLMFLTVSRTTRLYTEILTFISHFADVQNHTKVVDLFSQIEVSHSPFLFSLAFNDMVLEL